jgi:hypothetical protein
VVQYVCVAEVVYINWFAVEHKLSPNATFAKKGSPGERLKTVRKLGLGELVLSLLQIQQLARRWNSTLVLQTNPHTAGYAFYKGQGFKMAISNSLQPLLGIFHRNTHSFYVGC